MRDSAKVIIILSISFLLVTLEHSLSGALGFSGLLAVMGMGIALQRRRGEVAARLSAKYSKLWVAAELLLFVLVGATVDVGYALASGGAAVLLIFGVLGSIFGGIATPTEAAGIGALFSLILAIFYKQFSWKMLYESLIDTAKTTAMVFIILFGAAAFTGVFMSLDGDQIIADWVLSMGIGKWGAFAIMMVIMFLLGMFIDWLGIVMIVFPIFLPIMDTFGFDRLWLVAVSATLLQTCFMTPPFGFALFYVKGILPPSIKIQEVYRGVIPFIIIICIVTALCAVFPPLVTWLPSMLAS